MRVLPVLLMVMSAVHVTDPARGQEPALLERTYFSQLFPKPTGRNGYEDLVLAGDYLRTSEVLRAAQQDVADTLATKRAALNDPPVKRALQLLRSGLSKPLTPIHPTISADTLLPEFALFRSLARTLLFEEYVRLADGDVQGAIESVRDGLRLGAAAGADGDILISGLVQVAVNTISIRVMLDHMGQLSAKDCDSMVALVLDWMKMPEPSTRILLGEKRYLMETWKKVRSDPGQLDGFFSTGEDDDSDAARDAASKRKQLDSLAQNTSAYQSFIDSVSARTTAHLDAQIQNAQLPPWKRKTIDFKPDASITGYVADMLLPSFGASTDRFITERANMQMLGVHAALHRYLWEHDRLPESLRQLKPASLLEDPFTGEPFIYVKTSPRTYELSSAGPYDRGTDERPPSGKRVPFSLPRKPAPGSQ